MFHPRGLTKEKLRSIILRKLKTQKEECRKQKSSLIKNRLFRQQFFRKAKVVMFYIALDGEVNTLEMIKAARMTGKTVAVPVCRGKNFIIRPCVFDESARLVKGPYGISEPAGKKWLDLSDIDLVVVPGIAFDRTGNRLGRGKGCYDRFLKGLPGRSVSVGLAFDFQVLPALPTSEFDVSVKKVIYG